MEKNERNSVGILRTIHLKRMKYSNTKMTKEIRERNVKINNRDSLNAHQHRRTVHFLVINHSTMNVTYVPISVCVMMSTGGSWVQKEDTGKEKETFMNVNLGRHVAFR